MQLNKTAIEEEWNKMSEEFILKACKSFRRPGDRIIEKNGGHYSGLRELVIFPNTIDFMAQK